MIFKINNKRRLTRQKKVTDKILETRRKKPAVTLAKVLVKKEGKT